MENYHEVLRKYEEHLTCLKYPDLLENYSIFNIFDEENRLSLLSWLLLKLFPERQEQFNTTSNLQGTILDVLENNGFCLPSERVFVIQGIESNTESQLKIFNRIFDMLLLLASNEDDKENIPADMYEEYNYTKMEDWSENINGNDKDEEDSLTFSSNSIEDSFELNINYFETEIDMIKKEIKDAETERDMLLKSMENKECEIVKINKETAEANTEADTPLKFMESRECDERSDEDVLEDLLIQFKNALSKFDDNSFGFSKEDLLNVEEDMEREKVGKLFSEISSQVNQLVNILILDPQAKQLMKDKVPKMENEECGKELSLFLQKYQDVVHILSANAQKPKGDTELFYKSDK